MRTPATRTLTVGLLSDDDDDDAKTIIDALLDTSGSAASGLRPGFVVDRLINFGSRRVERKLRLDELDEQ